MLPYQPYLAFLAGLTLTVIPIATTYPGVEVPPWVGLGLAILSAAAAYLLKSMAPASDVHKDADLPPSMPVGEYAALEAENARLAALAASLQDDLARQKRVKPLKDMRDAAEALERA